MTTTISAKPLSTIGIGTYGIGGRGHRDMPLTEKQNDDVYVEAIVYALNHGSNFTEVALGYGHGRALELLKLGLDESNITREDVFITHSFYPRDFNDFPDIQADAKAFYELMDTAQADSILVTQSLILKFGTTVIFTWLHSLLDSKRTRFVSLSNASPSWIKLFKTEFGDSFFAHEGHLSFEVRALEDKGVFSTCTELGVENIIWRPLRRSATLQHNYPLLTELARRYNKTQSQIILNWMTHLGYKPMVFSTTIKHIDENLQSTEFKMQADDYSRMTAFRLSLANVPEIDWEGNAIDGDIVGLVSDIEKYQTRL